MIIGCHHHVLATALPPGHVTDVDGPLEPGIGVLVHRGTSPVKDTVLEHGRPVAPDDVARRFPDPPTFAGVSGWREQETLDQSVSGEPRWRGLAS